MYYSIFSMPELIIYSFITHKEAGNKYYLKIYAGFCLHKKERKPFGAVETGHALFLHLTQDFPHLPKLCIFVIPTTIQ